MHTFKEMIYWTDLWYNIHRKHFISLCLTKTLQISQIAVQVNPPEEAFWILVQDSRLTFPKPDWFSSEADLELDLKYL